MGGLSSIATTAVQAIGAASTIAGAVDRYQDKSGQRATDELKARNALELQTARERAALDQAELRLSAETAEAERRAALRRAVAKQRAVYGASGTSYDSGSGEAVLLGLFEETDAERERRESLDRLKSAAIEQNVSQVQRVNTLELAQSRERGRLKALSAFSDL